ncbi:MarR family transcriptional regulator [Paenibacillus athensensis]|uniref:HTH marR-type domain-containing protein n=1 Tax=Paenibacillus athensensis TaxID=1967502 RepID=A0A4Y8QA37_9BACL|nr:MarR family transcriptional regulator [Paenibacillus athensensis]MCD1259008.1 MarR family transcriptional regulator [Paenibacillus athensensis]
MPSHPDNKETMQELLGLLEQLGKKIKDRMVMPQFEHPLSTGHVFLLMNVYQHQMCTASDIVAKLGVTSGAVTGLSDKLVEYGLIHRTRSEEDRRVVQFTLTDQGREVAEKLKQDRLQRLAEIFGQMEKDDLQTMLDSFRKLNSLL